MTITWTSSGTDNHERYRDPALLRANDDFIASAFVTSCRVPQAESVRWATSTSARHGLLGPPTMWDLLRTTDDVAFYRLDQDWA